MARQQQSLRNLLLLEKRSSKTIAVIDRGRDQIEHREEPWSDPTRSAKISQITLQTQILVEKNWARPADLYKNWGPTRPDLRVDPIHAELCLGMPI